MSADTPGPGKFEACLSLSLAESLYQITPDEFIGSVDELGFYGIIRWYDGKSRHFIINEDTQGFFTYREFSDLDDANFMWTELVEQYHAGHPS